MKIIVNKIDKKKTKKRKIWWYGILAVCYLFAIIFVVNDTWLYQMPVVRVKQIVTMEAGTEQGIRGTDVKKYTQKMTGNILNGTHKGETVEVTSTYTETEMLNQEYRKGDCVFLDGTIEDPGTAIRGMKRDSYLVVMIGFLILTLVIIAGKQGMLIILTLIMNIFIFMIGFSHSGNLTDILSVCNKMVIAFAIVTLFCMNGCNKKTVSALLSTLCVLAMVMTVFSLVVHHTEELDFSTMEYLDLRSIDNPEEIFYAEILLSGLGAIMDVAVDISTALSEIIKQKPEISFRQLFRSGREIGHDIMGTMINILLFVFISGLIPMCLIRMNNDVSFLTIIRLHIPCELCRFFVESIGIVLAIPVSVLITSGILKSNLKKRTTLC